MPKSLLDIFRGLERSIKDSLADLPSPRLMALAALSIAHEKGETDTLSAEHIVASLEAAGVSVKKIAIIRAMARAGDRVSANKDFNGEIFYKLMTKGLREVAPHLGGGGLEVIRFDSGKPRSARLMLGEVLSNLKGSVSICDPYYGCRTLDSLEQIPAACPVRFLTSRTNEPGHKIQAALRDFKTERPKVEFRLAAPPVDIHDRYVLTDDQLLIVGHGLKDIGGKESFMVRIGKDLAPDLLANTQAAFDARWLAAASI